jgi:hypothetical protein
MSRLKGWLAALGALLLAALGVYAAGRRDGHQKADRREDEAYRETRERIDEVHLGDDPALARRFLHERSKSDGNL